MTIPGKGGRPRKWKSDADRVRAFRARQRGEAEPKTLDEIVDHGGEVAALWTQLQDRRQAITEQSATVGSLRSEIRALEQRLADERDRCAWIHEENGRLRSELSRRPKRRSDPRGLATDGSRLAPNRAAVARSAEGDHSRLEKWE